MTASKTEIERKFLVACLPDLNQAVPIDVRQGYLTQPDDSAEIRLRQKGDTYLITLKQGSGLERIERETEISRDAFDALWPATEGRRVEKTRWKGELKNGLTFELDLFLGGLTNLQLVEVEFASSTDATVFDPPDWFGRDVTNDAAYSNAMLSLNGVPDE